MNYNLIIGIVIGAVSIGWLLWRYLHKRSLRLNTDPAKINWKAVHDGAIQLAGEKDKRQLTPQGILVYSVKGLSDQQLDLIDKGATKAFEDAAESGYKSFLRHQLYTVYIPRAACSPAPLSGIPAFLVRADVYDGTDLDQLNPLGTGIKDGIGVIYAAEMVLNFGPVRGELVVCADTAILENAVRFGVEHIVIARNDLKYFLETRFHADASHPLLPKK